MCVCTHARTRTCMCALSFPTPKRPPTEPEPEVGLGGLARALGAPPVPPSQHWTVCSSPLACLYTYVGVKGQLTESHSLLPLCVSWELISVLLSPLSVSGPYTQLFKMILKCFLSVCVCECMCTCVCRCTHLWVCRGQRRDVGCHALLHDTFFL